MSRTIPVNVDAISKRVSVDTNYLRRANVLVALTIKKPGNSRKDKAASKEYADQKGISADEARVFKTLLGKEFLKPIDSVCSKARRVVDSASQPWSDAGWRILPKLDHMALASEIATLQAELAQVVSVQLRDHYTAAVREAAARLGPLFDPSLYPSTLEMQNKYSIKLLTIPMPNAADARYDQADEIGGMIAESVRQEERENLEKVMVTVWGTVGKLLTDVQERLESGPLTSAVDNLLGLVAQLDRINYGKDARLDELHYEAKRRLMALQDKKSLVGDKNRAARDQATRDVKALIDDFSDMWG